MAFTAVSFFNIDPDFIVLFPFPQVDKLEIDWRNFIESRGRTDVTQNNKKTIHPGCFGIGIDHRRTGIDPQRYQPG
ncbi:hypothetical protein [Pseudomonas sp. 2835]|uniref:hypothetical protein n=1 Tax=Pseudomonas sp. 2835 TaxID=3156451 RepID=UPI003D1F5E96